MFTYALITFLLVVINTGQKQLLIQVCVYVCGPCTLKTRSWHGYLLLSPSALFGGEGMRLSLNLELVVLSKLIDRKSLTLSDKVADALQLSLAIPW